MDEAFLDENCRRQVFIEQLYHSYGRDDPDHPQHGHYSGLWQEFCLGEAGIFARDHWIRQQAQIREMKQDIAEGKQCEPREFIST